jgi:hypothetical protein
VTITRLALVATLLVPGVASAQNPPSSLVLTTKHFAFHSDLATNVHDALLDAGTARRAKQPELFAAGAEKACFDRLPAAERDAWTRSVEYYATSTATNFHRLLMRLNFAGLLPRTAGDAATWQLLDEVASMRDGAIPAYRQCRWAAQDAQNRDWVARLQPLLATHEAALGEQLPRLFQVPWVGLPYRVDIVETGISFGANAVGAGDDAQHILVSSKHPDNQDRAALEVIFHEASHALATMTSPLAMALDSAVKESGGTPPRIPLLHAVHFAISGEAVRRAYAQSGGAPYTPYLYSLKMFGDAFNDVAARIWPAYVDGTRTMPQAAAETVRALATPAKGN